MKLRYTVQLKTKTTFTNTDTGIKDEDDALNKISNLKALNSEEGYDKYSNFRLYYNNDAFCKTL